MNLYGTPSGTEHQVYHCKVSKGNDVLLGVKRRQSQADTKREKLSRAFLYVFLVDSFASTKERYVSN